jgi:hypothetical protein
MCPNWSFSASAQASLSALAITTSLFLLVSFACGTQKSSAPEEKPADQEQWTPEKTFRQTTKTYGVGKSMKAMSTPWWT